MRDGTGAVYKELALPLGSGFLRPHPKAIVAAVSYVAKFRAVLMGLSPILRQRKKDKDTGFTEMSFPTLVIGNPVSLSSRTKKNKNPGSSIRNVEDDRRKNGSPVYPADAFPCRWINVCNTLPVRVDNVCLPDPASSCRKAWMSSNVSRSRSGSNNPTTSPARSARAWL